MGLLGNTRTTISSYLCYIQHQNNLEHFMNFLLSGDEVTLIYCYWSSLIYYTPVGNREMLAAEMSHILQDLAIYMESAI